MFAIAAIVLFLLDAFGVDKSWMLPVGLACIAVHLLVGTWPLTGWPNRQP